MIRRLVAHWRPSSITGGAAIFPLLVLFGLNLVDELDRSAFLVLAPDIRDHFGLDNEGILGIIGLVSLFVLLISMVIGYWADRLPRARIATGGAMAWGAFSLLTALSPTIGILLLARVGSGLGRAVNEPTHNSLLADYYAPDVRPSVYGFHRAANSVGQPLGAAAGGVLAYFLGWRAPFFIFVIPTAVLVVLAFRLREPVRGAHERRLGGADDAAVLTEEEPPSWAEGWRMLWQVRTAKRIWASFPFFAVPVIALLSLYSLYYEDVFGLNEAQRGLLGSFTELAQLAGVLLGIPFAMRLMARDPGAGLRLTALSGTAAAGAFTAFALAPSLPLAVLFNVVFSGLVGLLAPVLWASLSLVLPPRARSMGFSAGLLFLVPGVVLLPIVGGLADAWGVRSGLMLMVPTMLVGSWILSSAGRLMADDVAKVRAATTAHAEVLAARRRGEVKQLLVKDLDVGYDGVQVLFGVDFEVGEGEIVALLGTNGAGKSTLLRAISGLVDPSGGAIVFDGRDTTFTPAEEMVVRGVIQVPGGKGIFPDLSVAENLRVAGWLYRRDHRYVEEATARVLGSFPELQDRLGDLAGNLSGGQQQMLTLGMAFIAQPRLLMIDELSLGLAPVIVERLLQIVREIHERGTTVILVEQSVNVALTAADTAYFMEKGEIRFHGRTADLLRRPDLLRSVFLEGAASVGGNGAARRNGASRRSDAPARRRRGSAEPILEVNGLTKSFGGIRAVGDVTFSLARGEILGIIGPNGAGKTTLFDLVSGFERADGGTVALDGLDLTPFGPDVRARLGLGRSFQDARLFPALTVEETVAVALERRVEVRDPIAAALNLPAVADSEAAVAARVDELIELMRLEAFREKFVSELSTGSRRIVDLACVLAHEPDVILFDEPSSGIAQRETEALGPLLRRVRDETGASLVVIEHDMPLVTTIADEILALDLGSVVVRDTPQAVVRHPQVVASYLGTSEELVARSGAVATKKRSSRSRGRGGAAK
ncbi:MAG: MFS transporter [Actinobacteria bacterium]|nr:MFS transporter [Actinomycetota bacterium]